MNVLLQNDTSGHISVPAGSSSGNGAASNEHILHVPSTPDSVTSTVTVMPNLQWSATSPNTASLNNPGNQQDDCKQTEA